jgi:hypothetical protein
MTQDFSRRAGDGVQYRPKMLTKAEFIKALQDLPNDATIQDAMDRLYVLYKIDAGLADLDAGRVVTDEELTKRVKQWRK